MTLQLALERALRLVKQKRPAQLHGPSCRYRMTPTAAIGCYTLESSIRYNGQWTAWSEVDRFAAFGIDDVLSTRWVVT